MPPTLRMSIAVGRAFDWGVGELAELDQQSGRARKLRVGAAGRLMGVAAIWPDVGVLFCLTEVGVQGLRWRMVPENDSRPLEHEVRRYLVVSAGVGP